MWFEIILLSIVEGVTEYLPVSSTGHMIIAKSLLGMQDSKQLNAFLVIVQAGAILAVVSVFWRTLIKWLFSWLQLLFPSFVKALPGEPGESQKLRAAEGVFFRLQSLSVALSVIPFAIVGFVSKDFVKSMFSYYVVSWALIVGGVFLIASEKLLSNKKNERTLSELTLRDSVIVGLGQCLALWPGFSRAGATLIFSRFAGFSRTASAEISFLVGLPTLLGTAGYEALKEWKHLDAEWIQYLMVGILISWLVAFVCVKTFVRFLKRFSLTGFGYYRIVFGVLLLWMASRGIVNVN